MSTSSNKCGVYETIAIYFEFLIHRPNRRQVAKHGLTVEYVHRMFLKYVNVSPTLKDYLLITCTITSIIARRCGIVTCE